MRHEVDGVDARAAAGIEHFRDIRGPIQHPHIALAFRGDRAMRVTVVEGSWKSTSRSGPVGTFDAEYPVIGSRYTGELVKIGGRATASVQKSTLCFHGTASIRTELPEGGSSPTMLIGLVV